jgi:pimeloyl-ACP methyl ester carboxylesterase
MRRRPFRLLLPLLALALAGPAPGPRHVGAQALHPVGSPAAGPAGSGGAILPSQGAPIRTIRSAPAPGPSPAAAEAAYRALFSAESLGVERPSAGLTTSFTLHYRGAVPHAAFAFAREAASGRAAWGFVSGRPSADDAATRALGLCEAQRGTLQGECRLLIQDGALRSAAAPPFDPVGGAIGPFRFSPLHLRRGPDAARGALVWGHGYGGPERDLRGAPAPGIAAILNDAGWDVLRFDRHPGDDALFTSQPRLVAGLAALGAAGYRRIVLGGQSRGGWQAIMAAAERPDLVEAVIAIAPAAHGEAQRPNNHAAALEDFRRVLAGLPAEAPRLLVALFDQDDFDPSPEERAALLEALARDRPAPLLALWPRSGIRGHTGIADWRFTRFYGGCVLTLVQAPAAAAPRGLRREPCGGG